MCLVCLAYRTVPGYPLVLVANRDEFLARPTEPLAWGGESVGVLAGRDLTAGGTWLGLSANGRLAALTNYRDPHRFVVDAPSRGQIVMSFLQGDDTGGNFWASLSPERYNGFNLLVAAGGQLQYFSNRSKEARLLPPGIYGLSNHLLDTAWPKVVRIKRLFADAVVDFDDNGREKLLAILADRQTPPDQDLPDTGVGLAWERILSPIFITSPTYGTRSSAVITIDRKGRATFVERTYDHLSAVGTGQTRSYSFEGVWQNDPADPSPRS